jgi:hypothetical protein
MHDLLGMTMIGKLNCLAYLVTTYYYILIAYLSHTYNATTWTPLRLGLLIPVTGKLLLLLLLLLLLYYYSQTSLTFIFEKLGGLYHPFFSLRFIFLRKHLRQID